MSSFPFPALRNASTILFDVGNTLHHLDHAFIAASVTRHSHEVSPNDVAIAEYRAKAAVDEWFRAARAGTDSTRRLSYFEIILEVLGIPTGATEGVLAEIREEDARECLWRVMDQRTPEILDRLRRRGLTLGVISNADGRVRASLEASGIASHFKAIIDSFEVGVEKPDARIFQIAMESCGTKAERSAYVGDLYEIDIRGAREAGLTPVLLDPLSRYGEVDCVRIDSLAKLLDLLP